ncbi:MAG TPA: hypothetical protein VGL56_12860 [Fimbriimonadaceae bacterium]
MTPSNPHEPTIEHLQNLLHDTQTLSEARANKIKKLEEDYAALVKMYNDQRSVMLEDLEHALKPLSQDPKLKGTIDDILSDLRSSKI